MPKIDGIEHTTYNLKSTEYLTDNKSLYEGTLHDIQQFINTIKNTDLGNIKDIIGLDEESFQIDGEAPLNILANNLQKDINEFFEEMTLHLEDSFRKEVQIHKLKEANKSYKVEKDWYLENGYKNLVNAIESYNTNPKRKVKKYVDGEDTGEYETYYKATLKKEGELKVSVGYSEDGTKNPKSDMYGNSLISGVSEAETQAINDYNKYVKPVEDLKNKMEKYEGINRPTSPEKLNLIDKSSGFWDPSSNEDTASSDTTNDFERDDYTIAAHLHDDSGDFILYRSDEDGYYYVFDLQGNKHKAYYKYDPTAVAIPLTEELLEDRLEHRDNRLGDGYIKVKTGADFGNHNFDFSNEVDSMTSDQVKEKMANSNKIKAIEGYTITNYVLENKKEAGKYPVYENEKNGKWYIEGQDGKMHKVRDVAGYNRYKVETGGALGDEHYKMNKTITTIDDSQKNNFWYKEKVGTYNGYNVYVDENDNAYIETFPGKYTPLTNNSGFRNPAHMTNNDGTYKFDVDGVKIDTSNRKTQDVALENLDKNYKAEIN